jgi:hypothetical protein
MFSDRQNCTTTGASCSFPSLRCRILTLIGLVFWVDTLVLEFKKIVQILYQLVEFLRVLLCSDSLTENGHAFAFVWGHLSRSNSAICV